MPRARIPAAKILIRDHIPAMRGFLSLIEQKNAQILPSSHQTWKELVPLMFDDDVGPLRQWEVWARRPEVCLHTLFKKVIEKVHEDVQVKIVNEIELNLGNDSLDKYGDMYVQQMRAARLEEMKKQESSNLKAAQQVQMELNEDKLLLRPPPDDSHRVDSMHSTACFDCFVIFDKFQVSLWPISGSCLSWRKEAAMEQQ